jgi:hypothetical protein
MKARTFCLLFATCAAFATASPVVASDRESSDREYNGSASIINPCEATAPDGGIPASPGEGDNEGDNSGGFRHICRVDMLRNPVGGWQASTDEWMLFRVGDAGTLAACQATTADVRVAYTLDGRSVDSYVTPCQQRPAGDWLVDFRFLSHPLRAGVHTVTATWTSTSHLNFFLTQNITVMPGG